MGESKGRQIERLNPERQVTPKDSQKGRARVRKLQLPVCSLLGPQTPEIDTAVFSWSRDL